MTTGLTVILRGLTLVFCVAGWGCNSNTESSHSSLIDAALLDVEFIVDEGPFDGDVESNPLDLSMVIDAMVQRADGSLPLEVNDMGTASEDAQVSDTSVTPARVLFVGNSFTFWHDGLPRHLEGMRSSANVDSPLMAEQVVRGGASLEVMWTQSDAPERIASGEYDVVVLQEDLPETNVESFYRHARLFHDRIQASGARTVLYMTWDYERLNWISMAEIAEAYWTIAERLDVPVAPAGLAWKRAQRARPELDMYDRDREHPSIHGVFLTTSVLYAVLFNESPEGLSYRPMQAGGVNDADAAFLQRIAWEEINAR